MYAVISREKIQLPPGTVVRLAGTWADYQALVEQIGDRPTPRLKYRPGEIFIMSPMARHGREVDIISDIVKVLLDYQGQEYEAFTPITLDLTEVRGVEPDYCFYIAHRAAIIGKDRLDFAIDPPPDLVIEIDVTSFTEVNDYLPYRIPEVWIFQQRQLKIYLLVTDAVQGDRYELATHSRQFPTFDLPQLIETYYQQAQTVGASVAIKALKRQYPMA
jgi:Uma2 family endonuclease